MNHQLSKRNSFRVRHAVLCVAVVILAWWPARVALADEAPQARAYMNWLQAAVVQIEEDLVEISAAGERAAPLFLDGRNLGVRGRGGLASELGGRAGGLMSYRGQPGNAGDIILYALGVPTNADADLTEQLVRELSDAQSLKNQGSLVIGIVSIAQLESLGKLDAARQACSVLLDNHAPADDGALTDRSGRKVGPTITVANAIVAWAWTCELFAACTRAGKTPTVFQSLVQDKDRARYKRYEGVRFHEDRQVPPQASGALGRLYLQELRRILREIGTASWTDLVRASDRARETLLDGGRVYVAAQGHYPVHHIGRVLPSDPGDFDPVINAKGKPAQVPGLNDLVIAVGYCFPPGAPEWKNMPWLGEAGRGVIYVLAGHDTPRNSLSRREWLVDQQWPVGDAVVRVEGYDVRIAPVSGITSIAMLWMIQMQVHEDVLAQRAADKRLRADDRNLPEPAR